MPSSDHCYTDTVPPSSEHYCTNKVASPKVLGGGHGASADTSLACSCMNGVGDRIHHWGLPWSQVGALPNLDAGLVVWNMV